MKKTSNGRCPQSIKFIFNLDVRLIVVKKLIMEDFRIHLQGTSFNKSYIYKTLYAYSVFGFQLNFALQFSIRNLTH